jgi:hypothetical protein
VRERYSDFGPSLAAEKLAEHHGCSVSRETLRGWMIADGLWQDRRHRLPSPHQPRRRRDCLGELVQKTFDTGRPLSLPGALDAPLCPEDGDAAALLGVSLHYYTRREVLTAYRALAMVAHPDTGGSTEKFEQLVAARNRLLKLNTNHH